MSRIEETRRFSLHEQMGRYDWAQMAPRYDELLEQVVVRPAA